MAVVEPHFRALKYVLPVCAQRIIPLLSAQYFHFSSSTTVNTIRRHVGLWNSIILP